MQIRTIAEAEAAVQTLRTNPDQPCPACNDTHRIPCVEHMTRTDPQHPDLCWWCDMPADERNPDLSCPCTDLD